MSETGRPTALGVARARFVEGLPRKATELRASTALLVAAPAEERPREELRRRLHALWASAQVFQIEALCDGLKDAIERLDRARDQKSALRQDDLDALAALAATLPLLGNKATPGAPAVPSAPPAPALLRESATGLKAPRLRPPRATGRPTLVGIGSMPMPSTVVELETVCTVAVLASAQLVQSVRDAFAGDPRLEIHEPDPGEATASFLGRCGPDAILCADAVDAAALRDTASRIGAIVRVLGAEVTGGLPSPTQREAFSRALKLALRELPPLDPVHIAARLEDLETALASDRARVSNRFDGLSIGALLGRIETGRPDSSIHLRDAYDAIDAEMRGGQLRDVIRTARDGWYSRGAPALIALLGMRRGLVAVERSSGPVRKTLPDPDNALAAGRERLAAIELATRPGRIDGIATLEIDTDAAASAKKERAVDSRVLDAVLRIGAVAPLLEGGTSREGLAAALLALARSGALLAIRGPAGEDRIEEALSAIRSAPPPSEPEIRTLTQVPPPPSITESDEDDEEDEDEDDEEPIVERRATTQPDEDEDEGDDEGDEPARDTTEVDPVRADLERAGTLPAFEAVSAPIKRPAPTSAPPPDLDDGDEDDGDDDGDDDRPAPLAVAAPARREPATDRRDEPAPPVAASSGPPDAFIYALVVAVLFLLGFVIWRTVRPADDSRPSPPPSTHLQAPPATTSTSETPETPPVPTPPATATPPATSEVSPPPPAAPGIEEGASFGATRANDSPPPAGSGWIVADEGASGWSLDGAELTPGVPVSATVGVHPLMHGRGESVRVRFVRVRVDRTRVVPTL
jgi:hypothetical protein